MGSAAPIQNTANKSLSSSKIAQTGLLLQRKCSCGGSGALSLTGECDSCRKARLQRKISIGASNDPLEQDADRVADQVMAISPETSPTQSQPRIRRATGHSGAAAGFAPANVEQVLSGPGKPLDSTLQQDMGQRFGYDFSHVRVHTGHSAAESASSIGARAYSFHNHVVFGDGEYQPKTVTGKHLIAHELAHVAQGNPNTLYRRLKVDARASDDPATAIGMIAPLVTQLCPDFETDTTSGEIRPRSGTPCSIPRFADVASGSNKLGCCCLCTMTRPWGHNWRIIVTSTSAPTTDELAHTVRMTPTSGPNMPQFQFWTAGPQETRSTLSNNRALGHELCGHAALMKIRAHPGDNGDRSFNDVHDPTVRVENALAREMGITGPDRGLAGGGATHRGESLRIFSVGPFNVNSADITPFASQITVATNFLNGDSRLLYDTVGFRDTGDTNRSISAARAANVQSAVNSGVTAPTVPVQTAPTPASPETLTRAQPVIDGGIGGSRTVEIRIAIRPAGLNTPIGTPPPATPVHVNPTDPGRVSALKRGSVNQCHQLLTATAWP